MFKNVELFAGAGGMELGVSKAGFHTVVAVEMDEAACETLGNNFPDTLVIQSKVESVAWDTTALGPIDLVSGGPSCQSFSCAGKGLGASDARNCWPAAHSVVATLKPRAFLFENVKNMAGKTHKQYLDLVIQCFSELGYTGIQYRILNSADFGVPQSRERLFIVGFQSLDAAATFQWPETTHSMEALVYAKWVDGSYWGGKGSAGNPSKQEAAVLAAGTANNSKKPWVTVANTIEAGVAIRMEQSHAVSRSVHWPSPTLGRAGHIYTSPEVGLTRSSDSTVAKTRVQYPDAVIRRITADECVFLQGFPVAHMFAGTDTDKFHQVGNACPPALAYAMASSVKKALE